MHNTLDIALADHLLSMMGPITLAKPRRRAIHWRRQRPAGQKAQRSNIKGPVAIRLHVLPMEHERQRTSTVRSAQLLHGPGI